MKQLTEREAWLYLAEKWEQAKPDFEGDYGIFPSDRCADCMETNGLCGSVDELFCRSMISETTADRMDGALRRLRAGRGCTYWWTLDVIGAQERATACGLLAAMCEDEE